MDTEEVESVKMAIQRPLVWGEGLGDHQNVTIGNENAHDVSADAITRGSGLVTTSAGERKSMVWNMLRSQVFQFSLDEEVTGATRP